MRKKFIYIFLLLSFLLSSVVFAETHTVRPLHSIECSSQFKDLLFTLQKLPRAKAFIETVLEEGEISIQENRVFPQSFTAYWDSREKTIWLTTTKGASREALMSSLLFELHNASRERDFQYFDTLAAQRKISKKKFVEAIEYIEYQNLLATVSILEEGIEKGVFPSECKRTYDSTFKEHFHTQKETGHSAWIEEHYDYLVHS